MWYFTAVDGVSSCADTTAEFLILISCDGFNYFLDSQALVFLPEHVQNMLTISGTITLR